MNQNVIEPSKLDEGDDELKFSTVFQYIGFLGAGSFGCCVSAKDISNGQDYAVKIIPKKVLSKREFDFIRREAEILSQIDHPNVVKFVKTIETKTRFLIVMELIKGGQLKALVEERHKANNPLTDEEVSIIMKHVFLALEHIHRLDIVHRDIKLENILIQDRRDLRTIKVCDFGLSDQFDTENLFKVEQFYRDHFGTRLFMAPEILNKKTYGKPVDIYSCGIILFMLFSGGEHPFYDPNDTTETYKAKQKNPDWKFPPHMSKNGKHFFLHLVEEDPRDRYTHEEIKSHPWITRNDSQEIPMTSTDKHRAFAHSHSFSRFSGIIDKIEEKNNQPKVIIPIKNTWGKTLSQSPTKSQGSPASGDSSPSKNYMRKVTVPPDKITLYGDNLYMQNNNHRPELFSPTKRQSLFAIQAPRKMTDSDDEKKKVSPIINPRPIEQDPPSQFTLALSNFGPVRQRNLNLNIKTTSSNVQSADTSPVKVAPLNNFNDIEEQKEPQTEREEPTEERKRNEILEEPLSARLASKKVGNNRIFNALRILETVKPEPRSSSLQPTSTVRPKEPVTFHVKLPKNQSMQRHKSHNSIPKNNELLLGREDFSSKSFIGKDNTRQSPVKLPEIATSKSQIIAKGSQSSRIKYFMRKCLIENSSKATKFDFDKDPKVIILEGLTFKHFLLPTICKKIQLGPLLLRHL